MREPVSDINTVKLSGRLQAVAGMVTEGNIVCDVGCDHGFVSIYLIQQGISPKVIAMDVNKGPLQAAGEHVGEYGLAGYIETRLSNGVEALAAGEADALICAGMGGRLVRRILEEGKDKIRVMKECVLQPQSEIQMVREYLRKEGYRIADEDMVLEEGKYYPVIKALPPAAGQEQRTDCRKEKQEWDRGNREESRRQRIEDRYGPVLLEKKSSVLEAYLRREHNLYIQIMEKLCANGKEKEERQKEIADRIKDIETALSVYDSPKAADWEKTHLCRSVTNKPK